MMPRHACAGHARYPISKRQQANKRAAIVNSVRGLSSASGVRTVQSPSVVQQSVRLYPHESLRDS